MPETIPQPPALPLLGNAWDLDSGFLAGSLAHLAEIYGPIYKLTLAGQDRLYISTRELCEEVCDEERFHKTVSGPLDQVRNGIHDGLFTAYTGEYNWGVAHRTLMPAFGPIPIRGMFAEMHDIASQLILKWARFGPSYDIDVTSDFTRLTLDSIALCAMGTRFNSFYHEEMHPFVHAMVGLLQESADRASRPAFANHVLRQHQKKYDQDIAYLQKVARDLIGERRKNPSDKKDLLNAMVLGKDPQTGQHMTEDSMVNNMITLLIAGHETTSGLLSFTFAELIRNPEAYHAAQKEVDDIVGRGPITVDHLSKLHYVAACLRESLRIHPTASSISVTPYKDEIIGGKWPVKAGQSISCLLLKIQTDPTVYGADAEQFKPERMLDEPFSKLPSCAWKPFGNGARGCIGRPFAWQEALLITAMLLQTFNFSPADVNYQLRIKSTLTIKPAGFFMHATMRHPEDIDHLESIVANGAGNVMQPGPEKRKEQQAKVAAVSGDAPSLHILYGSNTGTCESLATSLASSAGEHGFNAHVDILDKAVGSVPESAPVVIITASYEGQPPDNAGRFVAWLKGTEKVAAKYAVFGCGNSDWQSTYQKVPALIDDALAEKGATRLAGRGAANVGGGDVFNDFDKWVDETLWPAIDKAFGKSDVAHVSTPSRGLSIKVDSAKRTTRLRQDLLQAMVTENRLLTAPGKPRKRHIEFQLPTGVSYQAGDYLAVLPLNPLENVRRAMARFALPWDATIEIDEQAATTIPTGRAISAFDVLTAFVELSQPATAKQLQSVAETIDDPKLKQQVLDLAEAHFKDTVQAKNISLLDVVEKYPSAQFTLGEFLAALPAMRTRQYSISSTPLKDPTKCTLTYTVLDAPGRGDGNHRFLGVCSNYLEQSRPGDILHVALRPSHAGFHLPLDNKQPVIMACAGTGLAPFRAFVQERALKIAAGNDLSPAMLFFGCNSPEEDDMYKEEFEQWERIKAVEVHRAYTLVPDAAKGCKYVQHRLWHERDKVTKLFQDNGALYICGAGPVGAALFDTMAQIYTETKRVTNEEAQQWVKSARGERYWADVFS